MIDSLIARCDALDGLKDGIIFNTKGCDFDPGVPNVRRSQERCLPYGAAGRGDQAGLFRPKGFKGRPSLSGISVRHGHQRQHRYSWTSGAWAKPRRTTGRTRPAGRRQRSVNGCESSGRFLGHQLEHLSGHGGKLLFYHGASDPWFSPLDTLEYFLKMDDANGGVEKARSWSRLYFIPGMGHCGGGEAALDRMDMLSAVVDWVEKGLAPDSVIATNKAFPGRSRPLCAYPNYARYRGKGDLEDARSFTCQE